MLERKCVDQLNLYAVCNPHITGQVRIESREGSTDLDQIMCDQRIFLPLDSADQVLVDVEKLLHVIPDHQVLGIVDMDRGPDRQSVGRGPHTLHELDTSSVVQEAVGLATGCGPTGLQP